MIKSLTNLNTPDVIVTARDDIANEIDNCVTSYEANFNGLHLKLDCFDEF